MKVIYIGENESIFSVLKGKTYECLGREHDRFRIIDETGEDYLYSVYDFEVVIDEENWAIPSLMEAPYWRDGMTPEEYEIERTYFYEHIDKWGTPEYIPLWKQKDT